MPWNEPGDPSKNKDPWTGRPKQTPPDLEAFLRDLYKKIVALFKLSILQKKTALVRPLLPAKLNTKTLSLVSIFCLLAWLALGFFKVNTDESAVITHFGAYSSTMGAGFHWILKPFQHATIINSGKINKFSTRINLLTRDENKIEVNIAIDYSIVDPRNFLFAAAHPLFNLQETTHGVVNRVLSQFTLNQLLNISHFSLAERIQKQLNALIKDQTGLAIKNIDVLTIQVPEQLQASFADVASAKSDKEQLEKQANVYATQVEPQAQLLAQQLIIDANAYQQEIVLKAKMEIIRFLALLPAYETSPTLTKKQLYLAVLQTMMAHSNKLLLTNHSNINSLTRNPFNSTKNIDKLAASTSNDDKKENTDNNELSRKTNDCIPSSYNISGGYE